MAIDPKAFAERIGAVHVGSVPDCGGGAFGAARLAHVVAELSRQARLDEANNELPETASPEDVPPTDE